MSTGDDFDNEIEKMQNKKIKKIVKKINSLWGRSF